MHLKSYLYIITEIKHRYTIVLCFISYLKFLVFAGRLMTKPYINMIPITWIFSKNKMKLTLSLHFFVTFMQNFN